MATLMLIWEVVQQLGDQLQAIEETKVQIVFVGPPRNRTQYNDLVLQQSIDN